VQVDPIKPTLKAPGTKRLKLKVDDKLTKFAFNLNLRHYTEAASSAGRSVRAGSGVGAEEAEAAVVAAREALTPFMSKPSTRRGNGGGAAGRRQRRRGGAAAAMEAAEVDAAADAAAAAEEETQAGVAAEAEAEAGATEVDVAAAAAARHGDVSTSEPLQPPSTPPPPPLPLPPQPPLPSPPPPPPPQLRDNEYFQIPDDTGEDGSPGGQGAGGVAPSFGANADGLWAGAYTRPLISSA